MAIIGEVIALCGFVGVKNYRQVEKVLFFVNYLVLLVTQKLFTNQYPYNSEYVFVFHCRFMH